MISGNLQFVCLIFNIYLDVGCRLGGGAAAAPWVHDLHHHPTQNATATVKQGVATNVVESAELRVYIVRHTTH